MLLGTKLCFYKTLQLLKGSNQIRHGSNSASLLKRISKFKLLISANEYKLNGKKSISCIEEIDEQIVQERNSDYATKNMKHFKPLIDPQAYKTKQLSYLEEMEIQSPKGRNITSSMSDSNGQISMYKPLINSNDYTYDRQISYLEELDIESKDMWENYWRIYAWQFVKQKSQQKYATM